MIDFECLYFLDTQQLCILEIKLTNLPANAEKTHQYQWLLVNKSNLKVKKLQFNSTDSSHEIEERFFDLGYLKFDASKGVYISKEHSAQYPLENTKCEEVPTGIMETIARYLNGDDIVFL